MQKIVTSFCYVSPCLDNIKSRHHFLYICCAAFVILKNLPRGSFCFLFDKRLHVRAFGRSFKVNNWRKTLSLILFCLGFAAETRANVLRRVKALIKMCCNSFLFGLLTNCAQWPQKCHVTTPEKQRVENFTSFVYSPVC